MFPKGVTADPLFLVSRRRVLHWLLSLPLVSRANKLFAVQESGADSGVRASGNRLRIGERPAFVASGSVHYFRIPHELWRDRLLRAKRAGLNCIETYVPWNFHQPEEGEVDFRGDRDLEQFLTICRELGLWVFIRPGPFICSEWDAGGYPAWLISKKGTQFRVAEPIAMSYVRRWYEQLIPRIAKYQVTRGGPVIFVQSENEYLYCDRDSGLEYLMFLNRLLREFGIDVPITDCNGLSLNVSGSLKTLNTIDLQDIERYRKANPGLPVIFSEFWISELDFWGWPPVSPRPPLFVAQHAMDVLSKLAMYNFYMFHGGTNFGFWASSSVHSDHSFVTTQYYGDPPLSEAGALDRKYFATKFANLLVTNFQDLFSSGESTPVPLNFNGSIRTSAVRGPGGVLIFVLPKSPVQTQVIYNDDGTLPLRSLAQSDCEAELALRPGVCQLSSGEQIELAEAAMFPMAVPFDFRIDDDCRIDFANATILGYSGAQGSRVILLVGEAGRSGYISINGRASRFVFAEDRPVELRIGSVAVLAVPRELADRTWFADGRVLIGPAYVGERRGNLHECWLDGRVENVATVSPEGQIANHKIEPRPVRDHEIRPEGWESYPLPEVGGNGEWSSIEGPKSVEELKVYYGYCWYRAKVSCDSGQDSTLFFPQAADRIHVFQGGHLVGIWGRGPGAVREPLPCSLAAGENEFIFLCDNMGRSSEGSAHEMKGILAPVHLHAKRVQYKGEWSDGPALVREDSWEFKTYRCRSNAGARFSALQFDFELTPGKGACLGLRWIPQFAWIYVNGHFVGQHGGNESLVNGNGFGEFSLDTYLTGKQNHLEITFFGKGDRNVSERVVLYEYSRSSILADWQFRAWQPPARRGRAESETPVCWQATFRKPEIPGPFFLVTQGLRKGQVYLNGLAVGRYWEVGPQHRLYLPEPWIREDNRLMIFDEHGARPEDIYLVRDIRVPESMALL